MSQQKIILVAGPTASGKSALALQLAARHKGAVINADAMQVYDGLPLLSAQPLAAERAAAPHFLYGTFDPAAASSAGVWLAEAHKVIRAVIGTGWVPILTGGTGLYFRALFGGLAEIPPIPDEARAESTALYDELGEEKFRARLAELDAETEARLARNDRQRLIRAMEVALHTGQALSVWQKEGRAEMMPELQNASIETHVLTPERDALYAACDKRFRAMVDMGAVEEARMFLARGLSPALPAMKTIGLRELGSFLNGEITLDDAIAKAQQATRNYAKRQLTWFRNQKLPG